MNRAASTNRPVDRGELGSLEFHSFPDVPDLLVVSEPDLFGARWWRMALSVLSQAQVDHESGIATVDLRRLDDAERGLLAANLGPEAGSQLLVAAADPEASEPITLVLQPAVHIAFRKEGKDVIMTVLDGGRTLARRVALDLRPEQHAQAQAAKGRIAVSPIPNGWRMTTVLGMRSVRRDAYITEHFVFPRLREAAETESEVVTLQRALVRTLLDANQGRWGPKIDGGRWEWADLHPGLRGLVSQGFGRMSTGETINGPVLAEFLEGSTVIGLGYVLYSAFTVVDSNGRRSIGERPFDVLVGRP